MSLGLLASFMVLLVVKGKAEDTWTDPPCLSPWKPCRYPIDQSQILLFWTVEVWSFRIECTTKSLNNRLRSMVLLSILISTWNQLAAPLAHLVSSRYQKHPKYCCRCLEQDVEDVQRLCIAPSGCWTFWGGPVVRRVWEADSRQKVGRT